MQSVRVDKGLTTKDITSDMFMEEQDKVVDVVNLTVRYSNMSTFQEKKY